MESNGKEELPSEPPRQAKVEIEPTLMGENERFPSYVMYLGQCYFLYEIVGRLVCTSFRLKLKSRLTVTNQE